MTRLEGIAVALGLINVALVVKRSVWNYPFGLAMVALYFFVFYEALLYSDALLQIFFFVVQIYGWRSWAAAKKSAGEVQVGTLDARGRVLWIAGTAIASLIWGLAMARFTDAAAPLVDAGVAGTSVAAQVLLARRRIENWVLWILVDIVAIGLYWSRDLRVTSGLYAVFLVLATGGLVGWARALRDAKVPA
jgi:nicotinamide mononucleotide transporter